MGYKMEWIFIRTEKGKKIGRVMFYDKLATAKRQRQLHMKHGFKCSKIAKKKAW